MRHFYKTIKTITTFKVLHVGQVLSFDYFNRKLINSGNVIGNHFNMTDADWAYLKATANTLSEPQDN